MSGGMVLDAKGLRCPLPVLRARKALKDVPAGDSLTVLATDSSAPKDFEAFCETTGCELLENTENGGIYTITIRKPD